MSKPGKLNEILGDFETDPDYPQLEWRHAGPVIQDALQKKKRRRRRVFFWWLTGLGLGLVVAGIIYSSELFVPIDLSEVNSTSEVGNLQQVGSAQEKELENNLQQINYDHLNFASVQHDSRIGAEGMLSAKSNLRDESLRSTYSVVGDGVLSKEEVKASVGLDEYQVDDLQVSKNRSIEIESIEVYMQSEKDERLAENIEELTTDRLVALPYPLLRPFHSYDSISLKSFSSALPVEDESLNAFQKGLYVFAGFGRNSLSDKLSYAGKAYSATSEIGLMLLPFQNNALKNFEVSVGLQLSADRVTTSFTNSRDIMLYRPGTVDTVFRFSIGEQTQVTTDSIPGIETRVFRNTSAFTQWSVPIGIGYNVSLGMIQMTPELGVVSTFLRTRSGSIADEEFSVTDITQRSISDIRLSYRLGLKTGVPLGKGQVLVRYVYSQTPRYQIFEERNERMTRQTLQLGFQYPF